MLFELKGEIFVTLSDFKYSSDIINFHSFIMRSMQGADTIPPTRGFL